MNIVLSIKPQFTNLILDGSKTIEMRTKIGKNFINGATIIIYSSNPIKAIVATAKINKIQILKKNEITEEHLKKICISEQYFNDYMQEKENCYLIELKHVKKLGTPLHLKDLRKLGFTAPQSFCYAKECVQNLIDRQL
ncbi:ASCH domain-containing protein [Acinetobacter vivianii]|uniref:ASCH domain-containing protein n=1 Tax=Acinetobacter vivianii TaxID=1776742 RepID=A0AAJ6P5K4_9GAMM|nr:ASCH domain-containing protein [Acinetobacter vivianii]WDZ51564.1 ASCH domain-containing protein [Acinetobacter vivianii]